MERTRKGNSWSRFLARLRADRANGISSGVVVRYVAWISPRSPEEYSLHRTQGREIKSPHVIIVVHFSQPGLIRDSPFI